MIKKNRKKGQAALEFLMTYGWAFLVILIVIGAFVYFDVLNPAKLVPARCSFSAGFACNEHIIRTTDVEFVAVNRLGYTITDPAAVVKNLEDGEETICDLDPAITATRFVDGDILHFKCTFDVALQLAEGERFQGDIIMTYMRAGGSIDQQTTGSIGGNVVAPPAP